MKKVDIFKGIFGIGIFIFVFFLSTVKVDAGICSSCKDGGPTPTLPTCPIGSPNCVTHEIAPDQEDFNCGGDQWMGYTEGSTKYCCTPYYTYECGTDPDPVCTCSCPSVLQKNSNNWYVLNSPCTSGTGCSPFGCFEIPSAKPNTSLERIPETNPTTLGFNSDNHTGSGEYYGSLDNDDSVNDFIPYSTTRYTDTNKPFSMKATFTDPDSKDIEALYVWFTTSAEMKLTPKKVDLYEPYIDTLGVDSGSKSDFGFLLHWNGTSWIPYVPKIYNDGLEGNDWWVKAEQVNVDGKTVFSIPWNDTKTMANVIIYSITATDGRKKVVLDFGLSFKSLKQSASGTYQLLDNHPLEGKYNIFLMANDKFGFTPYDNYSKPANVVTAIHNEWNTNEKIRFYDKWIDTGVNWNLNFDKPGVELTIVPKAGTSIEIGWRFIPDPALPTEFSTLVLNMYKSEGLEINDISSVIYSGGGEVKLPLTIQEVAKKTDITGYLDYNKNKYLLKTTTTPTGSMIINLGDVGSGYLYFNATVFDKGGNVGSSGDQILDLNDWIITQGGLLYSEVIGFSVKESVADWSTKSLLSNVLSTNAALSTELVAIKDGSADATAPVRSATTGGYMIRPYLPTDINGYYSTLKGLFDRRKDSITNLQKISDTNTLSNSLSNYVLDGNIGYLATTSLNVLNGFVCNRQAVFFISGDLNINGNISNSNVNKDACIFVVGGKVDINNGTNVSGKVELKYDQLNAYILSDSTISISRETGSSIPDGLYISGGLHSLSDDGVMVYRRLNLADRLKYPVLVVNHHSKYGVLADKLFGSSTLIQKTEIGIKPY